MKTSEEEVVLSKVKSSFPCWLEEGSKKSFLRRTNWKLAIIKFVVTLIFVLLVIFAVGTFIRQAKCISIWFLQSGSNSDPEKCEIS